MSPQSLDLKTLSQLHACSAADETNRPAAELLVGASNSSEHLRKQISWSCNLIFSRYVFFFFK